MSQIRIISGSHRSRRIEVQDAAGLRPTTDRIRETVFNWLAHDIYGKRVLDLFAGSGALGFEAASRGAAHVDFVDSAYAATKQLQMNNTALKFESTKIHRTTAQQFLNLSTASYDLIFLDPPFDSAELNAISAIIGNKCKSGALLYREYRKNQKNDKAGINEINDYDIKIAEIYVEDMNPELWNLHKQKTAGQVCFELWKRI